MKAMTESDLHISRKELLKPIKRVVVKIGSGVLTAKNGLNKRVINDLSHDINEHEQFSQLPNGTDQIA